MISLPRMFSGFAKACTSDLLRNAMADVRADHESLGGAGQAEDEHQAVMRLLHNTGRTAL